MTQLVLTRIAPWPAGRMLAVLYLVLGIIASPFLFLASLLSPQETGGERALGVVMSFFLPFLYAFIGLVAGIVGGALFNLFARLLGGIPLTFEPSDAAAPPRPEAVSAGPRPGGYGE